MAHDQPEHAPEEVQVLPEHRHAEGRLQLHALAELRQVRGDLANRLHQVRVRDQRRKENARHERNHRDKEEEEALRLAAVNPKLKDESVVLHRVQEPVEEDGECCAVEQRVHAEEGGADQLSGDRRESEPFNRLPAVVQDELRDVDGEEAEGSKVAEPAGDAVGIVEPARPGHEFSGRRFNGVERFEKWPLKCDVRCRVKSI